MIDSEARKYLRVTGRPIVFRKIASLATSAKALGFTISSATNWVPSATYSAEAAVTKNGRTFISRAGSNTNHDPEDATSNTYWVEVDSNGIPLNAVFATLQAETQAARWRNDGIDPDANTGNLLYPATAPSNNLFLYDLGDLYRVKLIEATSGSTLNVTFFALN